jgi:glucosamine--fructose-6-phosphate aminotransferase (isomerizing)
MCGIFGVISNKKDLPIAKIIREGMQRLEYRGYDSAGIALVNNDNIELRKKAGRICEINKDEYFDSMQGQFGVGHTRWATHGAPVAKNSHPHLDCDKKIAVVHNGIIENYQELRKELSQKGHILVSDTDTEVLPHLIEDELKKGLSLKDAVINAVKKCSGSYGIVVCHAGTDYMVAARKESPLTIGVIRGESTYCASDIPAFLPLTRTSYVLEDEELAILKPGEVEIYDIITGEKQDRKPTTINWSIDAAEKVLDGKEYKWFMHKELHEVPKKIKEQLRANPKEIEAFAKTILESEHVYLTAAGTAFYAGLTGKFQITRFGGPYIEAVLCSEFKDSLPKVPKNSCVIAVSQSGETADTIEAVKYAKENGAKICSLVNVVGSSLTRHSDNVLITTAGPEIAVASQKAFCTQVTALNLVALKIAELKKTIPKEEIEKYKSALLDASEACEKILSNEEEIKKIAESISKKPSLYYLGRGASLALAKEGALKLKEISYNHAEAYPAGESKHGPIALITKDFPAIFVAQPDETYDKLIGNIMEMKSRGATIISVVADYDTKITEISDITIKVPIKNNKYSIAMSSVPFALPLQLLAYFSADYNGSDLDKPRNLAKSVTVK